MQVENLFGSRLAAEPRQARFGRSCFRRSCFRRSGAGRIGAVLAILALAGCGGAEPGFLALTAATSTVINSDKLPTDFIADAVTGLDCNSIRQSMDKGPLCRAPEQRVIERPVYCYRTLGTINCYDQPDPYRDGAEQVSGTLP
ncbi:hypothetical protein EOI86_05815 [Hwanghaeella grinnelliae]|uniref:Uncharacterized protein n=1 Tax=Hwanghaeella grinnelliae TaxID=2500179 RepID=A0A437QW84_9PROT|nr:hypothetical protein [Hwanghaeella grinnelliae]RVU38784.1 hypothetical protein EOI86_05815 [Hwanghaeella grinnelliae]